jgi:hypothetical protein
VPGVPNQTSLEDLEWLEEEARITKRDRAIMELLSEFTAEVWAEIAAGENLGGGGGGV